MSVRGYDLRALAICAVVCALACGPDSVESGRRQLPELANARSVTAQPLPAACASDGRTPGFGTGVLAAGGEDIFVLYERGAVDARPEIQLRFPSLRELPPERSGDALPFALRETAALYTGTDYGGLRSVRCAQSVIDPDQTLLVIEYTAAGSAAPRSMMFLYALVGPSWQRIYESARPDDSPRTETGRFYFNGVEGALCVTHGLASTRLRYSDGKLLVKNLAVQESPAARAETAPVRLELRVTGLDSTGQPVPLRIGKPGPGDAACRQSAQETREPRIECVSSAASFSLELSATPPAAALRGRIRANGHQVFPAADASRRVMVDADGGQSQVILGVPAGS